MASQLLAVPQVLPAVDNVIFDDKGWLVSKDGTILYVAANLSGILTLDDLKGKTIRYFKASSVSASSPAFSSMAVAIDTEGNIYGLRTDDTAKTIVFEKAVDNGLNYDEFAIIRGGAAGECAIDRIYFKDRVNGTIFMIAMSGVVSTTIPLARFKNHGVVDVQFDPITRGFYNKAGDIVVFDHFNPIKTVSFAYQIANSTYKDRGIIRYNSKIYNPLSGLELLHTGAQIFNGPTFEPNTHSKDAMYSDGNNLYMFDSVYNMFSLLYMSDYQKQSPNIYKSSVPLKILKDETNHHIHIFGTDGTASPTLLANIPYLYSSIGYIGGQTFPIYLRTLGADHLTPNTEDIEIDTVVSLRGGFTTKGFLLINSKTNRIFAGAVNITKKCWHLSEINASGTEKIGEELVPTAAEFIRNVKSSYAWTAIAIPTGTYGGKYVLAADNNIFYSYNVADGKFTRLTGPAQYTPGQGGSTGGGTETTKQIICSSPAIVASLFGMRVMK